MNKKPLLCLVGCFGNISPPIPDKRQESEQRQRNRKELTPKQKKIMLLLSITSALSFVAIVLLLVMF